MTTTKMQILPIPAMEATCTLQYPKLAIKEDAQPVEALAALKRKMTSPAVAVAPASIFPSQLWKDINGVATMHMVDVSFLKMDSNIGWQIESSRHKTKGRFLLL